MSARVERGAVNVEVDHERTSRRQADGDDEVHEGESECFDAVRADIWILTESHMTLPSGPGFTPVETTETDRLQERDEVWVVIWSRFPITRLTTQSDPARTVAALVGPPGRRAIVVYGTCLTSGADDLLRAQTAEEHDVSMMLSFSHIQLNVTDLRRSVDFYMSVLGPFGFREADSEEGQYARLTNGRDAVIVLSPVTDKYRGHAYHRKGTGLSHLAFAVESRQEVDRMAVVLAALGIPLLGEGKIESGYRRGYYTLAFEDPDRIMIEIAHHDPHYFSELPP